MINDSSSLSALRDFPGFSNIK